MLYRGFAAVVVLFWLVMTGLLLRKEIGPRDSSLREVPLVHVVKLMLVHEQPSDLQLYNGKSRIGHLRLVPHGGKTLEHATMDFTGTLQLALSAGSAPRQQIAWKGTLDFDSRLTVGRCRVTMSFREPAAYILDLDIQPAEGRLKYTGHSGGQLVDQGDFALSEEGVLSWLRQHNVDASLLIGTHPAKSAPPQLKALQASLDLHGEKIDTYMVSVEQGGQTMLEFHVDQLGHVLRATSFLGYTAAPDEMVP